MLLRVDDCKGGRQVYAVRVVMVTDNEIQADGPRVERFVRGADAAINSNDQFHAVCFEGIQRILVETVAFIESIRDVAAHVCRRALREPAPEARWR